MMFFRIAASILFALTGTAASAGDLLTWRSLPPLPDSQGIAAPYAGVVDGALVVAGGTNFPEGPPWDGGKKTWYRDAFVLDHPDGSWRRIENALPGSAGHGATVSTKRGLICIGGSNADEHLSDVLLLTIDTERFAFSNLRRLPRPAAHSAAVLLDNVIYVAGGLESPDAVAPLHKFWRLDLSAEHPHWTAVEPWPGPPRFLTTLGVLDGRIYLFGGVDLEPSDDGTSRRTYLDDAYCFDRKSGWTRIADLPTPLAASPGPAVPLGQSHLLLLGGDTGEHAAQVSELKDSHPGFSRTVYAYHPVTNTWSERGTFPDAAAVTTAAIPWWDRIVVPSGEVRPATRTPRVLSAAPAPRPARFTTLDGVVMAVYLCGVVVVGLWSGAGGETTADYFLGGRRIPWWAAGLSIFGTQLSAITFMAIPALAYHTDWGYFVGNMMIVVFAPFVAFVYLPMYRSLGLTSVYEYLERRFHVSLRLVGSVTFTLMQLARIGIVLYLPSLALSVVTGIDLTVCILIMGLIATLYTVFGGIEAVVWTDVVQVFVLLGGACASLGFVLWKVDLGFGDLLAEARQDGKLSLGFLSTDLAVASLGVIVVGRFFEQFVPYTADQAVVQRYFTTKDEGASRRSVWTNAILTVPASLTFFALGTALWTFYRHHPALLIPTSRSDEILPWFIVDQLPPGVSGLVIAGLFAAAMSSLDSSLNSVATTLTTDFYQRFNPEADDRRCLRLAKGITLFLGLLGTGSALYMAELRDTSMMDQNLKVLGLFGGGLAGMFAAGMLSRRITSAGALIGFFASGATLAVIEYSGGINFLLYAAIGIVTCIAVAAVVSAAQLAMRPTEIQP